MMCKITHYSASPTMDKNSRASRQVEGSINSRVASTSSWIIFPYFSENGTNRKINIVANGVRTLGFTMGADHRQGSYPA